MPLFQAQRPPLYSSACHPLLCLLLAFSCLNRASHPRFTVLIALAPNMRVTHCGAIACRLHLHSLM